MITMQQFGEIEIRVGEVVEAADVEKSNKLIKLTVDFVAEKRTIFMGVRTYGYTPADFLGKRFLFVTNLEYRKMMGEESQGMILAVDPSASSGQAQRPLFISAEGLPVGARLR